MGRLAKPLELHALTGTHSEAQQPGESRVPAGRPKIQGDLTPAARSVFKRLCKLLLERRALTSADSELVRIYAILFDRHRRAMQHVQNEGEIKIYISLDKDGVQVPREKTNLWLKVAETAEKNMVAIIDRLGLSPLNRDKVKPVHSSPEQVADNSPGTVGFYLTHPDEESK